MKILLAALALALAPTLAVGQTIQSHILWDYTGALVADVNAYQKSVTLDNAPAVGTTVCEQRGTLVTCRLSLAGPPLANVAHTVVVTSVANGVATEARATINPANGPKTGTPPRVLITIAVS